MPHPGPGPDLFILCHSLNNFVARIQNTRYDFFSVYFGLRISYGLLVNIHQADMTISHEPSEIHLLEPQTLFDVEPK